MCGGAIWWAVLSIKRTSTLRKRGFCVAIVLCRNAEMPRGWTMTGCIWPDLTPDTMADMRAALPAWRAMGYDARLELAELTSSAMVLMTPHLRALQRAWRRRWRRRAHAWLRRRPLGLGGRWP